MPYIDCCCKRNYIKRQKFLLHSHFTLTKCFDYRAVIKTTIGNLRVRISLWLCPSLKITAIKLSNLLLHFYYCMKHTFRIKVEEVRNPLQKIFINVEASVEIKWKKNCYMCNSIFMILSIEIFIKKVEVRFGKKTSNHVENL